MRQSKPHFIHLSKAFVKNQALLFVHDVFTSVSQFPICDGDEHWQRFCCTLAMSLFTRNCTAFAIGTSADVSCNLTPFCTVLKHLKDLSDINARRLTGAQMQHRLSLSSLCKDLIFQRAGKTPAGAWSSLHIVFSI